MKDKKTWALMSLASIPLVMTLGNSMLIPVLPIIERELDISSLQVSLLITVYSVVAIIFIPIAGYLSDIIGRKKVIIPSLILAAIGGVISGFAAWKSPSPYTMILVGRLLQGIGAAGAAPIVMPLVGDLFQQEKEVSRGLGIIETSNTFGKVLSPILGAYLATIVWYLPFWAIPLFCLFSILLMLFLVKTEKEMKEPVPFQTFIQTIKTIFKREGRWLYAVFVVGCICMFLLFGILFYLSTMLEERYQIEGVKKGVVLAIPLAALCIASLATGRWIEEDKAKMKWMSVLGLALLTASTAWIIFSESIYVLLAGLFISGIGIGMTLPSLDALVTEGIHKEQRGTITSLYNSMRFVGVAFGPPLFALLMKTSHSITFMVNAITAFLTMLLILWAIRPEEGVKPTWS
ncbi:MFS transporter [Halalkalibacterium halodurans]|uniref:MFS transporter n=1 Tax=Halalkalibacterium halodurans TaxID=86665 RepID=UPI002AAA57FF|nr:MFS transporter [Halalkalibacterium halodurans]MDY7223842.1 MFS transporter [Halalkalibacterium halodurans]MDY7243063.1 MFS transporter [Halalkalibacterium halodurans]